MAGFPIFVDVAAAAPLVVGGGDLALAKVRLLAKRAPRIDVFASRVTEELRALAADGRIGLVATDPHEADIRGRPLVISATGDDREDARVSALAQSFGVPVNVPDRPHLCTFSLAAIVDRGTVTLAIGTEGAAPVLAARLRADLELSIHPRLGEFADIAGAYRPCVAARVPRGAARRAFWDDVFGGAAADAILSGDTDRGRALIEQRLAGEDHAGRRVGRVMLVGAGPGDPDLLTLKAVRALKSADVILHDGLMGEAVLDHARREAQIISVAKAKGRHSRSQAEINVLMVGFAREGKTVVRLKAGDPSVFGRGGEEIDLLRASGIDVEVIPGITAATAVAASLQIPLTHRDFSRSVTFVSGHAAGEGEAAFDQVDFKALANGRTTLAVYMALSTSFDLANRLIGDGWSPATPVIAVSRATQAGERRIATSLGTLSRSRGVLALAGPTLLIIGEVAGLDPAGIVERLEQGLPAPQCKEPAYA